MSPSSLGNWAPAPLILVLVSVSVAELELPVLALVWARLTTKDRPASRRSPTLSNRSLREAGPRSWWRPTTGRLGVWVSWLDPASGFSSSCWGPLGRSGVGFAWEVRRPPGVGLPSASTRPDEPQSPLDDVSGTPGKRRGVSLTAFWLAALDGLAGATEGKCNEVPCSSCCMAGWRRHNLNKSVQRPTRPTRPTV